VLIRDHVGPRCNNRISREADDQRGAGARSCLQAIPVVLDDPAARKFASAIDITLRFQEFRQDRRAGEKVFRSSFLDGRAVLRVRSGLPKNKKLPIYEFRDGDVWGNIIFSDLEAGTSAWLYWNAILDETGGPWAVSPVHGNPDPNAQHPVVIVNKTTHEITYTGTYWYLAHFSNSCDRSAARGNDRSRKRCAGDDFPEAEGGYVGSYEQPE